MVERTLVLLRHAKADRPNAVADVDRSLTERGHADSAAAGAWLVKQGLIPDLVLCSTSRRTRQTWHSVAVALANAGSPHVQHERAIYDGAGSDLFKLLQSVEPEHRTVLLIGHNPTISQLSELLDPSGDADSDGLRTCGVAVHRGDAEWDDLDTLPVVLTYTGRAEGS